MINIKNSPNLRKNFSSVFGLVLTMFLILQINFLGFANVANPVASLGNQIEKVIQGTKSDMAIDKAAGTTKEIARNLRDGRADKLGDMAADSLKNAGNRTKELARDVKRGTKENISKAQNAAENTKNDLGDRTGNVIDSVKEFLGQ